MTQDMQEYTLGMDLFGLKEDLILMENHQEIYQERVLLSTMLVMLLSLELQITQVQVGPHRVMLEFIYGMVLLGLRRDLILMGKLHRMALVIVLQ